MVVVGGAPSSGTTLLADLLDSIPGFICPPELYVFCFKEALRFDDAFRRVALSEQALCAPACYASHHPWLNRKYFDLLKINIAQIQTWIEQSEDLSVFYKTLIGHVGKRQSRDAQVACEKTPININLAAEFCERFPDALFVHLVRSGPDVVKSLTRRGFTFHESAIVWLYQVQAGRRARRFSNYLELKYEDIVREPFAVAERLAERMGVTGDAEEIAARFACNPFRAELPRPTTWHAAVSNGKIIAPPPAELTDQERGYLASAKLRVRRAQTGDDAIGFNELMEALGYPPLAEHPYDRQPFLENYLRYSKNLSDQSHLSLCSGGDGKSTADEEVVGAVGEIGRLRKKIRKLSVKPARDQSASGYGVLLGPLGSAGQPGMLAQALRAQGIRAKSFLVGPNRFGYATDDWTQERTNKTMREALTRLLPAVDILHVHAITPLFTKAEVAFPMGTDLLAAKALGKRVIVHFRGSEVRQAELFRELSPFHYVDDNPNNLFANFPTEWQQQYLKLCRSLADLLVVTDPELQSYVPRAEIIQRAIDMDVWRHTGLVNDDRPLVLHAPSRQGVKGTSHVVRAVEQLRREGLAFEFQMIEGLSNEQARAAYERADIIVDQLRIGWYGVLAIEAMALGKAVVSYVRDDLTHHLTDQPPLAIANPNTITDVLRELVSDRDKRRQVAARGRAFCESYHSADVVAQRCREVYDRVMATGPSIDLTAYMEVNGLQEERLDEMRRREAKLAKRVRLFNREQEERKNKGISIDISIRPRVLYKNTKRTLKKSLKAINGRNPSPPKSLG